MIFEYLIKNKAHLSMIEQARSRVPVNIERLVENIGIRIERDANLQQAGYITLQKGQAVIVVNSSRSLPRQRFTIAHKLAHYLIHNDELTDLGTMDRDVNPLSIYTDKKEAEANALAADILMPMDEVDALIRYADIRDVAVLSDRLGVPEKAVRIKLKIPNNVQK